MRVQIPSGTPSFPTTYQATSRKLLESESSSDRALHGSTAVIRDVLEVDVLADHLGDQCVTRCVEIFACKFSARQECDPTNPVERCRVDWVAVLVQKALSVSLDHAWRSVTIKSVSARLTVILPPLRVVLDDHSR